MAYIISYRKASDQYSTYRLDAPDGATELCEIDGVAYVSIPGGVDLPPQPEQIADSVAVVDFSPVPDDIDATAARTALREAIKAASPHCQLIDERMRAMIRGSYTLEDELKFARIGVGAAMGMYAPESEEIQDMMVYGEFVEGVRQWGKDQRAEMGL
jgi:hypothetical protein